MTMAIDDIDHPSQEEHDSHFKPGPIKRVKLTKYQAYDCVKFYPGSLVNIVMGPNGTGKSAILCVICLGLGNQPDDTRLFFQHEKEQAIIKLELATHFKSNGCPETILVIKQVIDKDRGSHHDKGDVASTFIKCHKSTLKSVKELGGSVSVYEIFDFDVVDEFRIQGQADFVQLASRKVASDLRTLFLQECGDAALPILQSSAVQEYRGLVGAYVRLLDSKEHLLLGNDVDASSAGREMSQLLLYPMGRAVAINWTNGNQCGAGMLLRHIGAYGPPELDIVTTASRQMKKIDPFRILASHMASLRQSYENWVDYTPEF